MRYEFNWAMLLQQPYSEWIVDGVLTTIHLALLGWVLALALGIPVGICRIANSYLLRLSSGVYVEVFRSIPPLVQLFLWFYVFPLVLPEDSRDWWNTLDSAPYLTALIGISLFTSARIAEQVRSAISAIPRGQFNAALSTGLTPLQVYRHVIAPYAIRIMLPALSSEFLSIFKNTSLALTIGVLEITGVARKIESWSFKGIEAYSVASLTYVGTTIAVIVFMTWMEKLAHIPGLIDKSKRGL